LRLRDGWQILKQVDVLSRDNILIELFYTTGHKLSFCLSDIEVKYKDKNHIMDKNKINGA